MFLMVLKVYFIYNLFKMLQNEVVFHAHNLILSIIFFKTNPDR